MAERTGFEPAIRFPVYTLSKRAPSTTRPPLRTGGTRRQGSARRVARGRLSAARGGSRGRGRPRLTSSASPDRARRRGRPRASELDLELSEEPARGAPAGDRRAEDDDVGGGREQRRRAERGERAGARARRGAADHRETEDAEARDAPEDTRLRRGRRRDDREGGHVVGVLDGSRGEERGVRVRERAPAGRGRALVPDLEEAAGAAAREEDLVRAAAEDRRADRDEVRVLLLRDEAAVADDGAGAERGGRFGREDQRGRRPERGRDLDRVDGEVGGTAGQARRPRDESGGRREGDVDGPERERLGEVARRGQARSRLEVAGEEEVLGRVAGEDAERSDAAQDVHAERDDRAVAVDAEVAEDRADLRAARVRDRVELRGPVRQDVAVPGDGPDAVERA